jgi:hypothetical protein
MKTREIDQENLVLNAISAETHMLMECSTEVRIPRRCVY